MTNVNLSPRSKCPSFTVVSIELASLCLVALALLVLAPPCSASATNIYIAQNAVGAANGSDCSSAFAYTFFNNSANWSAGAGQIGPGTTVHLCGTFTDSVNGVLLTAQGDGANGNPITILFESGATLQSPAENTFIQLNFHSHFIVDGGTSCGYIGGSQIACNGLIKNTANGGALTNQNYGSEGIDAEGSNDVEVRNLEIGPLYVKNGINDLLTGAPGPQAIRITDANTISGVNIHNNILHGGGWLIWGGANNLTIASNDIYDMDHGLGMGNNTDGTSTISGISVHDNHIHDTGTWDTSNNDFHHDGIHIFAYAADGSHQNLNNIITNINIYNNLFDGDWGTHNTGYIFFEGQEVNANIFNNVGVVFAGRQLNNGMYNGYGKNINYFNNTMLGPGAASQTQKYSIFQGPNFIIKNSVWTDGGMIAVNQPYPSDCPSNNTCQTVSYALSNNAFLAPADFGNGFGSLANGFYSFSAGGFASFETDTGETGGVFRDATEPNGTWFNASTGAEIGGSPTIGAGTNLSGQCAMNGGSLPNAFCSDIAGNPRPATGAWDIGAYQGGSTKTSSQPAAPTALTVIVN